MKLKAYTDNPYYQLLIYLLVKFGITDFDIKKLISENPKLKNLDKEAMNEIELVQKFNRKFAPIKFYEFAQKFGIKMDFPSLLDIVTNFLVDKKIPVYETVVKSMEQSIAKFEKFKSNLVFCDERINFVENLRKKQSLSFFQTMFYKNYWQNYLSLLVENIFEEVVPARWQSLQYEPMALVAMLGNANLMESFLALNQDRSEFWSEENPYLLNLACRSNNIETFERLLLYPHRLEDFPLTTEQLQTIRERANQARFNSDCTLFHLACKFKNCAAVRLLLAVGAEVHKGDAVGELPLHAAVKSGVKEIVTLLWEDYKKNNNLELAIRATDNDGRALLHFASQVNGFEDIIENILSFDRGLVNRTNNFGFTPLHFACGKGLVNVAEILVKNGAQVVAVSNTPNRETPYVLIPSDITKEDKEKLEAILANKSPAAFRQEKFVRRLTSHKVVISIFLLLGVGAGTGGSWLGWWLFTFFKLTNFTAVAIVFGAILSIVGCFAGYKCFRGYEVRGLRSAAQKEAETANPVESTPLLSSTYSNVLVTVNQETSDVVLTVGEEETPLLRSRYVEISTVADTEVEYLKTKKRNKDEEILDLGMEKEADEENQKFSCQS